jgi:hypothetical protein
MFTHQQKTRGTTAPYRCIAIAHIWLAMSLERQSAISDAPSAPYRPMKKNKRPFFPCVGAPAIGALGHDL